MTEITVLTPEQELEQEKQRAIQQFNEFEIAKEEWQTKVDAIQVESIHDKAKMEEAKTLRIQLRDIRISAEKTKKKLKENSNAYNKAVDECWNKIQDATKGFEAQLLEKEKYAERIEAKRIEKIKAEREEALAPYKDPDVSFPDGLGTMDDTTFATLQAGFVATAKARKEAEEAAAKEAKAQEELRIQKRAEELASQQVAELKEKNEKLIEVALNRQPEEITIQFDFQKVEQIVKDSIGLMASQWGKKEPRELLFDLEVTLLTRLHNLLKPETEQPAEDNENEW